MTVAENIIGRARVCLLLAHGLAGHTVAGADEHGNAGAHSLDPVAGCSLPEQSDRPGYWEAPRNPALHIRPRQAAPGEASHYQVEFDLPSAPVAGVFSLSTEFPLTLWINGTEVPGVPASRTARYARSHEIGRYLRTGKNTLCIRQEGSGLGMALHILTADGQIVRVVSDGSWKGLSGPVPDDWTSDAFNASDWPEVLAGRSIDQAVGALGYWIEPLPSPDFLRVLRVAPLSFRRGVDPAVPLPFSPAAEIGRASCKERV